ncbi:MAG TPA: hypothetical protein VIA18_28685 [Polyangia bacterium]|jgi:hypothetical protein|nr:hypothetical protein [Polyangia bacterium]
MTWYHYVAYFFGAVFLTNAVPHLVSGMLGRPFQSPFAKPPGKGLSSSTVNALWGWLNVAIGYALLFKVGAFDVRNLSHAIVVGVAVLARSLLAARHFGQFHGGATPTSTTSAHSHAT